MEGSRTGVINRGENTGLGCVFHAGKYENVVELWKIYNQGRERIGFGKIILTVREPFSVSKTEAQRCVQWRWTDG